MSKSKDFARRNCFDLSATITIATDTKISNAVDLKGTTLVGVFLPSTFDGTAFTILTCDTPDGTYLDALDAAGNAIGGASVAASKYVALDPAKTQGLRYIKIKSTSDQTTTNTVIPLATRSI